jgi:hypothetical protein
MAERLKSPGSATLETAGEVTNIRGSNVGIGWMIGIAEWGEVGTPTEVVSFADFEKKFGGFMKDYYLAKCANAFFGEGGNKMYVVRTAHYDGTGVLTAEKSWRIFTGHPLGENSAKTDSIKVIARGHGTLGDKINVTNIRVSNFLASGISIGAVDNITVGNVNGFEVGDIIDIDGGIDYLRVIISKIDTATNTIYFKNIVTTVAIPAAVVSTPSQHSVRTKLSQDLESNATSIELENVTGIRIGMILTFVDNVNYNDVTVKVTDITGNVVSFADIGVITTIAAGDSVVISQEYGINVELGDNPDSRTNINLSMEPENQVAYIGNKFKSDFVVMEDQDSATDPIERIPSSFSKNLQNGDDGLIGLTDTDFIGSLDLKNGLYAFDAVTDMFAQIGSPDMRSGSFQRALLLYAESRTAFAELDVDFDLTPEEVKDYIVNVGRLNSSYGEISYPNVLWKNPRNGVIETIPQCGSTMGLNARVWGAQNSGPWKAAAGTADGVYNKIEGFESLYTEDVTWRDFLYEVRVNALYRYKADTFSSNVKYGIRTLEAIGEFPQVGERVTFLYCRHSIINGTPWIVFQNIDTSNLKKLKRTIDTFLTGVWNAGGLKGDTKEEAFIVDVSEERVNTPERQEAGEMWCSIGLATKKAAEFVYFEFKKKTA